jgi:hypothetical protein
MLLRICAAAAALALLSFPVGSSPPGGGGDSACGTALEGHELLPDTAATVPGFLFGGRLTVDRLLVCEDGVFFFFRTREWGHYMRFVLAWHKPTTDSMSRYVGRDITDPVERAKAILEATTVALGNYNEYLEQMREVLGRRYVEGKFVSFENGRHRAILEMAMGSPIEFTWRHRTVSCQPLIDLYFVPERKIPGWVAFLMLYPGRF